MNIELLKESIKKHEGLRLKVYTCPAGKQTIGYGRNLEDNGISEEEAELLLIRDLQKIQLQIDTKFIQNRGIFYYQLPENVQRVLLEMAYQIGVYGLSKFMKMLKAIREEDYQLASKEMLNSKWAKQTPNRALTLSNLMKGGK